MGIGIDLGTTNTSVCYMVEDNHRFIEDERGIYIFPTMIAFQKINQMGKLSSLSGYKQVIGTTAKQMQHMYLKSTVYGKLINK